MAKLWRKCGQVARWERQSEGMGTRSAAQQQPLKGVGVARGERVNTRPGVSARWAAGRGGAGVRAQRSSSRSNVWAWPAKCVGRCGRSCNNTLNCSSATLHCFKHTMHYEIMQQDTPLRHAALLQGMRGCDAAQGIGAQRSSSRRKVRAPHSAKSLPC